MVGEPPRRGVPAGPGPARQPDRGGGRRRRRRHGKGPAPERPGAAPAAPPAVIPAISRLADEAPAAEPLAPAEVAEMKEHLAFIRTYKEALRLRLNANEDLLVNGRREPSDRGVCRHLLGKVDRGIVEAAVAREPLRSDAPARARMLAGAIRLTADVGVLLAYLETLAQVRSRADAAQAFAEVVARIDFESLSATRLGRLLQVLTQTFAGHERVQVLFSLLAQPAFRRAFDTAAPALPAEVAEVFAPLRAVHRRLLGGAAEPAPESPAAAQSGAPSCAGDPSPAVLAAGLEQVLAAPDPILRGYDEPLRIRLLEMALGPGVPDGLADRAATVLLSSVARLGRVYTRLATRRAAGLLARHADDRARAVLEEMRRAAPGYRVAERWLAALDGRRMGRIALQGEEPERGRLRSGFWLDAQHPVWIRTAPGSAAERLATEAHLQASLALPGVAPVVAHGVASGLPYVAVAGPGVPLALDGAATRPLAAALALAGGIGRILRALALAGVVLPDAGTERFLVLQDGGGLQVTLGDLDGATSADSAAAATAHARLGADVTGALVPEAQRALLPGDVGERLALALADAADLVELIARLDGAALLAHRG